MKKNTRTVPPPSAGKSPRTRNVAFPVSDYNNDQDVDKTTWNSMGKRQEPLDSISSDSTIGTPATSSDDPTSTGTSSASSSSASDVHPTMINAPSQIGLIMPNPGSNVYTGVEYRMGYVDPGPAPRANGALRLITPLLTYPNHSTNAFPDVGSLNADPNNHTDEIGWCSVNLAAAPYTFPFRFDKPGWHQFIINTTWARPTITGEDTSTNCSFPLVQQYTFFGTKAVSVAPSPTTGGLIRAAPAYTVWTDLRWQTPGPLPIDKHKDTTEKKTIAGLSIAAVILAFGGMAGVMWWVRRRRRERREALALSRLGPRELAEYFNQSLPALPGNSAVSARHMHYGGHLQHERERYDPSTQHPPGQDMRYDPHGW